MCGFFRAKAIWSVGQPLAPLCAIARRLDVGRGSACLQATRRPACPPPTGSADRNRPVQSPVHLWRSAFAIATPGGPSLDLALLLLPRSDLLSSEHVRGLPHDSFTNLRGANALGSLPLFDPQRRFYFGEAHGSTLVEAAEVMIHEGGSSASDDVRLLT